jgi:PDZ domain
MDAPSKKSSRLPLVVLSLLLAGSLFAYWREQRVASQLKQANESLVAVTNEIARLRAENQEVTQLRAENQEIERLRRDNEDLYRLRNEVRQLKEEKATWVATRSVNEQPRVQNSAQAHAPPISTVAPVTPAPGVALPEKPHVPRPWLGFFYVNIPAALKTNDAILQNISGVLVSFIEPDSPADKAGLQVNDIVTKVQGQPVSSANELAAAFKDFFIGKTFDFEVIRQGGYLNFQMQAEDKPEEPKNDTSK